MSIDWTTTDLVLTQIEMSFVSGQLVYEISTIPIIASLPWRLFTRAVRSVTKAVLDGHLRPPF